MENRHTSVFSHPILWSSESCVVQIAKRPRNGCPDVCSSPAHSNPHNPQNLRFHSCDCLKQFIHHITVTCSNLSDTNSAELVTTLTVCVLIDGKEVLPHALQNEDVAQGVLMSWTHVEPRCVHALIETTFLVTYSSGILAEEIGSAIEKIDQWLGKPVVISCDEVTTAQLPQVIECACHTTTVESVVFNTTLDEMKSDSNPSGHSYAVVPSVQVVSGATFLNKMPRLPQFSGAERERRTLSGLNSDFIPCLMPGKLSMNNW